jgi:SAM-dependent methyltransferase
MRDVSCYFCGSQHAVVIDTQDFDDEYLSYVDPAYLTKPRYWKACEECGGIYHSPALDADDIERLYTERYRRHSLKDELSPDAFFDKIVSLPRESSENWEKVVWLSSRIGNTADTGEQPALLDVGCSAGMFIKLFLDGNPGWTGAGIEPTERFAETGSRRLNLPIKAGQYRSQLFGRRFQLITLIHVLEHLLDPRDFLQKVREDIAPGGMLYLEVPDLMDFRNLPINHDRFMSPHLYYFSRNSLGRLLAESGWRVVEDDVYVGMRGHANLRLLCVLDPAATQTAPAGDDPGHAIALRRARNERAAS